LAGLLKLLFEALLEPSVSFYRFGCALNKAIRSVTHQVLARGLLAFGQNLSQ
jgi:hypothetical protein